MARPLRLRLAFQRVKDELVQQPKSGRAFVSNAFELEMIEADYDGWITALAEQAPTWVPGPIEYCDAPKGGGLVRPGARLAIADRVVYTGAVGACLREIHAATNWSQRTIDFAAQLNAKQLSGHNWLRSGFLGWKAWGERSLRLFDRSTTRWVVTADIAGYFENISIPLLRSDLARVAADPGAVTLITKLLSHWSPTNDKGLPQGVMASDILAKVYLESFDRRLKEDGLLHVRYCDDIRVFCRTEREARRALLLITTLLRSRGLTLQSAKTAIRPADTELRAEFAGVVPRVEAVNRDYIDRASRRTRIKRLPGGDPSVPVSVIDDLIRQQEPSVAANPDETRGLIHRAFREFVLGEESPDKTMRRYLLRRLAGLRDDFAVDYCSVLIIEQPETSVEVLRYYEDLVTPTRFEPALTRVLRSQALSMYPYQRYLVLDWFMRNSTKLRTPTLRAIRGIVSDGVAPSYLCTLATALLGRFGDHADIEQVVKDFKKSSDPLERAQLACCLARLERGQRNALLGRYKDEAPWGVRATRVAKS